MELDAGRSGAETEVQTFLVEASKMEMRWGRAGSGERGDERQRGLGVCILVGKIMKKVLSAYMPFSFCSTEKVGIFRRNTM